MYGLFYARKNNDIIVIFLFKSKNNQTLESKEIQIFDPNNIKNFNKTILSSIKKYHKELSDDHYSIFYRTISNNSDLKNTMKELNINNDQINNPLVNFSQMDIEINNIKNSKDISTI